MNKKELNKKYNLIADHAAAALDLTQAKARELELRLQLVELTGANKARPGTYKSILPDYEIKAVCKMNIKLDQDKLKEVWKDLTPHIRAIVLKMTYGLNTKPYKELTVAQARVLDSCITKTPATPTIEVKEKKDGD